MKKAVLILLALVAPMVAMGETKLGNLINLLDQLNGKIESLDRKIRSNVDDDSNRSGGGCAGASGGTGGGNDLDLPPGNQDNTPGRGVSYPNITIDRKVWGVVESGVDSLEPLPTGNQGAAEEGQITADGGAANNSDGPGGDGINDPDEDEGQITADGGAGNNSADDGDGISDQGEYSISSGQKLLFFFGFRTF